MNNQRKRRVIIIATQSLLGEALANLLGEFQDVEIVGPWSHDAETLERLSEESPDVILLATQETESEETSELTGQILARFPDFPLVQVPIEESTVRLYTSKSLLASSQDLIETIRNLPMSNHL